MYILKLTEYLKSDRPLLIYQKVIHTFIFSSLDCCNALYAGISQLDIPWITDGDEGPLSLCCLSHQTVEQFTC